MQIHASVASVVGATSPTHWGQVLQLPTAYGVVEIIAPDGIARQRGVTILSKLTGALSQRSMSLAQLAALADELTAADVATLAILVPVGKVLYLVLRGGGGVFMRRGQKFSTLMSTPGDISGEVAEGDVVLLASSAFTQSLTPEEVAGVFDYLSPSEVAEKLTLILHEKQNGEGGAACIFEAAQLISPEEESVAAEAPAAAEEKKEEGPRLTRGGALRGFLLGLPFLRGERVRALARRVRGKVFALARRVLREKRMAATVVLVFLFAISVIVGVAKQRSNAASRETLATVTEAQHIYEEGMALMDLNAVKGRERLGEAAALLAPVVAARSDRSPEGRAAHDLYAQIAEAIARAQHVVKAAPSVFFDVSVVKKDAKGTAFAATDERMAILDGPGRTAYDLVVASKNGQIAGGGDAYEGATLIGVHGERVFILVPGGIHMVTLSDRKTVATIVKSDEGLGTIAALVAYGGNLYLLDAGKGRIWKYTATEAGFTERREYLNPDTLPDLSRAASMAIDGSVWVTTDGKIVRFTQGKEQTFVIQGLELPFGQQLQIFTSDSATHLYILDGANKRVVVLDKEGFYQAQYVWEEALVPTALAANEARKQIFLLAGGTIYAIPME
jgi:hypothetical protein